MYCNILTRFWVKNIEYLKVGFLVVAIGTMVTKITKRYYPFRSGHQGLKLLTGATAGFTGLTA